MSQIVTFTGVVIFLVRNKRRATIKTRGSMIHALVLEDYSNEQSAVSLQRWLVQLTVDWLTQEQLLLPIYFRFFVIMAIFTSLTAAILCLLPNALHMRPEVRGKSSTC